MVFKISACREDNHFNYLRSDYKIDSIRVNGQVLIVVFSAQKKAFQMKKVVLKMSNMTYHPFLCCFAYLASYSWCFSLKREVNSALTTSMLPTLP